MVRKDAKDPPTEQNEKADGKEDNKGKGKNVKKSSPAKPVHCARCVSSRVLGAIVANQMDVFGDETLCFDHEKTDCMLRSQYRIYVTNWEDAVAFQQEDRIEEAMEAYQKALSARPTDANSLANIASMYIDLEEYDNAKAELEKALAAHPSHISCLHNMASVYEHEKLPDKAKEYLNKVLAIDPENKNAIAYLNLINGVDASDATGASTSAGDSSAEAESPELDSLLD